MTTTADESGSHWADVTDESAEAPSIHDRAAKLAAAPVLGVVAQRIADVSPAWATVTVEPGTATGADTDGLTRDRAIGVEAIREGWLLHRGASRVAASASPDLSLLVGDWCYAVGLCDIADHGSLDDITQLANLVADISTRCDEPLADLAPRWRETTDALHRA